MHDFHKRLLKYAALAVVGIAVIALVSVQREQSSAIGAGFLVLLVPIVIGAVAGLTGALPFVKTPEERARKKALKNRDSRDF